MEIAVIGMNQVIAPINIRNKVAYLESDKIEFITELLDFGISEVVYTCYMWKEMKYIYVITRKK